MSTTAIADEVSTFDDQEPLEYRSLHTGALLGLLIAVVSLVFPISVGGLVDPRNAALLGVIPTVGLIVSLLALLKIRSAPDLFTGGLPAKLGVLIAAGSLLYGGGSSIYTYATEVPDGYARTSFFDMKPDAVETAGRQPIPPDVQQLIGKKVFLKGFIRPDSTNNGLRRGVTEFLLVRDNNQCCFGDISKVEFYDQVAVELSGDLTTNYHSGVFRLGGELGVRPGDITRGEPMLVYEMDADYIK
ncbi:MAG: hypothetical protein AAGJ46_03980 [Planctomycetota bacterium]